MAQAYFHPQVWIRDTAIEVDPLGDTVWDVGAVPDDMEDDDYPSDNLRDHDNAPQWVKDWPGPYWIEIIR
jgi:hypothetical protein